MASKVKIITSITPIALITSEIIQGLENEIICQAPLIGLQESVHDAKGSFSKVKACYESDLVFWIGPHLEEGLAPIFSHFPQKAYALGHTENLQNWLKTTVEVSPCCKHHNNPHLDNISRDWHLWYSPKAVELIAEEIATILALTYPKFDSILKKNLKIFVENLSIELDRAVELFSNKQCMAVGTTHNAYRHLFQTLNLPKSFEFPELTHASALSTQKFLSIINTIQKENIKFFLVEWSPSPLLVELKNHVDVSLIITDEKIFNAASPPTNYLAWLRQLIDLLDESLMEPKAQNNCIKIDGFKTST